MTKTLKVLIALLFLSRVGHGVAAEPFRVLTYNIRYQNNSDGLDVWDKRKETVVSTIKQAELAGLQEVVAQQYDYIAENSPGWTWYGVGRSDGLRGGEMAAVGWNTQRFVAVEQGTFWLSDSPFQIGKAGWDAALPRVASWVRLVDRKSAKADSAETLLLVNVHFDHKGQLARKNSGVQLRQWIADHRDNSEVILIGDFNAKLQSPPLEALLNSQTGEATPLIDTRSITAKPDSGPNSTWNGFSKIEDGNRIDHVLIQSNRLKVNSYVTLDPRTPEGRFASDHLPILVELNW